MFLQFSTDQLMSESLAQKPVNMIFIVSQRALHAEHDIVCQTCLSVCLSVCPSVCMSVCLCVCHTLVLYLNKCTCHQTVTLSTIWYGHGPSFFLAIPPLQNTKGNSLSGRLKYTGLGQICNFQPRFCLSQKRYDIGPWLLIGSHR